MDSGIHHHVFVLQQVRRLLTAAYVDDDFEQKTKDDPASEEQQGKNLAKAAHDAGVQRYIWSTLPSSENLSDGKRISQIYEGKHRLLQGIHEGLVCSPKRIHIQDPFRRYQNANMQQANTASMITYALSVFLLSSSIPVPSTKTWYYEGMFATIMTKTQSSFDSQSSDLTPNVSHGPTPSSSCTKIPTNSLVAMVYVGRDLPLIVNAIFTQWASQSHRLDHTYLLASDARWSPAEVVQTIERITGKKTIYTVLPSTGWPDRDTMFELYNDIKISYPGREVPDPKVTGAIEDGGLGVNLSGGLEEYIRLELLPALGLTPNS